MIEKTLWSIDKLKGWDKNPRGIKVKDYQRLIAQIKRLGQYKPLLITPDGIVLGGNMRLKAYQQLEIKEVWVSIVEPKSEAEMLEFALSDNDRVGYYEDDKLAELIQMHREEIDLTLYKVDLGEPLSLQDVFERFGPEVEEDEVPQTPSVAISKLGEVYQLGRHRLMCGDATKREDVEKLMDGQKADLVVTDPPYNTGMQPKDDSSRMSHVFNDKLMPEAYTLLLKDSFFNMFSLTKGECVFYVFIDFRNVGLIKELIEKLMKVNNIIVWDKVVHGLGSDYKFTYELIVVGKKGLPKIENRIGTDYQDIWRLQRQMGRNDEHATAKPIGLLKKPILHASKQDDIVLDLFGGSGSTLIACEQTNRTCYMMEISEFYCDVIRKRYENFINKPRG